MYTAVPFLSRGFCGIHCVKHMRSPFPPYPAIEKAVGDVVAELESRGVRLTRTELVTTSEEWDDSLGVWFFFEDDAHLVECQADGTTAWMEQKFFDALIASKAQYRFSKIPVTAFQFDSHENVVRNYEGSYFLRLR